MKSGGLNIPADKALDHVYGYGGRHRPHPPRPADRLAQEGAAVGSRQVVRLFRALLGVQPAAKIGHPAKGKIWLTVNGKETPEGRPRPN